METSARVLSAAGGNVNADLMFIGEAPGRLGADETMIPFHGDVSGRNFEDLISSAGISRADLFVTNAVLCNPKDEAGNNSTPSNDEIGNCTHFLARQIAVIQPQIVATLGAIALSSLNRISPHSLSLKEHVRTQNRWYGRTLIPLYHPGSRAMIHRSFANQLADYHFVSECFRRLGGRRKVASGRTSVGIMDVVREMVSLSGEISYFRLHKLFYLLEAKWTATFGGRLTSAYFIRQKDGPYCTDIHIDRLRRAERGILTTWKNGHLYLKLDRTSSEVSPLSNGEVHILMKDVIDSCKSLSESQLKTRVYLTKPMKSILRRERRSGQGCFNQPIEFVPIGKAELTSTQTMLFNDP